MNDEELVLSSNGGIDSQECYGVVRIAYSNDWTWKRGLESQVVLGCENSTEGLAITFL